MNFEGFVQVGIRYKGQYTYTHDPVVQAIQGAPLPREVTQESAVLVRFNVRRSIELGNMFSKEIEVGMTYPCLPEHMEQTFDSVHQWVFERVAENLNGEKP